MKQVPLWSQTLSVFMNNENIRLVCKSVKYHSMIDEDLFFEWIKKIDCITDVNGSGNKILLSIARQNIDNEILYELIALFRRYKINTKQFEAMLDDGSRTSINIYNSLHQTFQSLVY